MMVQATLIIRRKNGSRILDQDIPHELCTLRTYHMMQKSLHRAFIHSANGRINKYLQQLVLDLTTEITHELVVYDEPRESDGALAHGHHQCLDRTWPFERRVGYVELRLGPTHLKRQLAPTPADLCEGSNVHPSLINKLPFWRRISSNLGRAGPRARARA